MSQQGDATCSVRRWVSLCSRAALAAQGDVGELRTECVWDHCWLNISALPSP